MDATDFLTTKQAAEKMNVAPSTLRVYRQRGKGPRWIKVSGRLVLYPTADLEEWMAEARVTAFRWDHPNGDGS